MMIHPAAQRLMDGEWRNATYAEFAKFPLENVFALEGLFYRGIMLAFTGCFVSFGGLPEMSVIPGE